MTSPATPPTVLLGDALDAGAADSVAELTQDAERAAGTHDTVGAALQLATTWGERLPRPGAGRTAELWSALASIGAVDLTVARTVEPHLDALAILAEAGRADQADGHGDLPSDATWGVYAAEGPGQRLVAVRDGSSWVVDGMKPWCSLAERVSHALVTAWVDDSTRGLFALDLGQDAVDPLPADAWVAHGLPQVTSNGLRATRARALPIGEPGWYLQRQGFAWGGVGVAAVWFGAAVALARRVGRHVAQRAPDQIAQLHVGQLDLALAVSREALATAARLADGGVAGRPEGSGDSAAATLVAVRTRSVVAETVESVLRVADHAMGPAPLATDAEHAQRVSDLRLYVRQHHAERDLAALGRQVIDRADADDLW